MGLSDSGYGYRGASLIVPSDDRIYSPPLDGLEVCGSGGNVTVVTEGGQTVEFREVIDFLRIRCRQVLETGTTAGNIVGYTDNFDNEEPIPVPIVVPDFINGANDVVVNDVVVNPPIAAGFIPAASQVFDVSLTSFVSPTFLAGASQVFNPSVAPPISISALLGSTAAVYNPTITPPSSASNLVFVSGGVTGSNPSSVTFGTHQADDIIIQVAHRASDSTAPTNDDGTWTSLGTSEAGQVATTVITKKATGAGTTSGGWLNASRVQWFIFRGANTTDHIGGFAIADGIGTTITWPSITLQDAPRSSVVLSCMIRNSDGVLTSPPTGYTLSANNTGASQTQGSYQDDVASYSAPSLAAGGTSAHWHAVAIEVLSS